jgi:hypothetical protein
VRSLTIQYSSDFVFLGFKHGILGNGWFWVQVKNKAKEYLDFYADSLEVQNCQCESYSWFVGQGDIYQMRMQFVDADIKASVDEVSKLVISGQRKEKKKAGTFNFEYLLINPLVKENLWGVKYMSKDDKILSQEKFENVSLYCDFMGKRELVSDPKAAQDPKNMAKAWLVVRNNRINQVQKIGDKRIIIS